MTEAEFLNIFNEYINTSFMLVGILLSLITAFLIASYIAASKVSQLLGAILVFLYSAAYFWVGAATMNSNRVIAAFAVKMDESGYDFSWLVTDVGIELLVGNVLVVASYVASLVFFVYARRRESDT